MCISTIFLVTIVAAADAAFWHVSSGEINVFSWMCIVKKYFMKYNKTIKVRGGRLWKVS